MNPRKGPVKKEEMERRRILVVKYPRKRIIVKLHHPPLDLPGFAPPTEKEGFPVRSDQEITEDHYATAEKLGLDPNLIRPNTPDSGYPFIHNAKRVNVSTLLQQISDLGFICIDGHVKFRPVVNPDDKVWPVYYLVFELRDETKEKEFILPEEARKNLSDYIVTITTWGNPPDDKRPVRIDPIDIRYELEFKVKLTGSRLVKITTEGYELEDPNSPPTAGLA